MKSKLIKFGFASILMVGALVGCDDNEAVHTHTYDNGVILINATETSDGIKTYTCSGCNGTKFEIIPKTGTTTCEHTYDQGTVTTAATATSDGLKTFTCTKCNATKTEIIPMTGGNETPVKYTVSYNANGGTGTAVVDMNEYSSGERATVKGNTFTAPEGKEFINWNEEADGSGAYHNVNTSFKVYDNVTLYAQWLDIEEPVDPDAEYNIKVTCPTGVRYSLDHTKAKKDTTVTLTLSLDEGVVLNGNPTSSQVALTKVSDNVYTFVMPVGTVSINVKTTIDGDVVLTGDISAKLLDNDNDGIYTAEVACNVKTTYGFTYVVKDSQGTPKRLSSMYLDETKCDAPVTFSSGENQLSIGGGATYVFSYDSNRSNYNCYITRKSVDVLPQNSATLYNLFDGRMRSQSTVHPQGLTSIHYEKSVNGNDATLGYKVTNETYDYKKISDTESFAVSKNNLVADDIRYVYKNIDTTNDVYSIVNTYKKQQGNNEADDNVWGLDPYGTSEGTRFEPYSARQDIVDDSKYRDTSRYQITEREAYRNIGMAAHYGSALEYEIYKAIRGDFDGTATINAANGEGSHCSITSTARSGGFNVTLNSQLEYNHEESGSTADVTQQYAFVYNATFTFLTNGDLYKLNFTEKYYTKDNWNFTSHEPAASGTPITTTIKADYKYNENLSSSRATILGDFNPAAYFISSIEKLSFYDAKTGAAKSSTTSIMNYDDSLNIYNYLEGSNPTSLVNEFSFLPASALDGWQYGCINSSDKAVVDETPWGPKTVGVGTATATFGNHLQNMNGPTKDVSISVLANGRFNSLFVNCTIQNYDSFDSDNASTVYGYAGKTMKFYIDSGNNTGCPISYYMVIKTKDEFEQTTYTDSSEYFNVLNGVGTVADTKRGNNYVKMVGHDLKLDFNTPASNALKKHVQVDVILMSEYYNDGFGPSIIHIDIGPDQGSIVNTSWKATYYYDAEKNPSLADKKYEEATVEFMSAGVGKITEVLYSETGTVKGTNVYNFSYTEANNGTISAHVTSVNVFESDLPKTASSYSLLFERTKSGSLGVALYTDELNIFGSAYDDGDGYIVVENLDGFEKVIA